MRNAFSDKYFYKLYLKTEGHASTKNQGTTEEPTQWAPKPKAKERSDGNEKTPGSRGKAPGAFRPDFPRKVRENPSGRVALTLEKKTPLQSMEKSPKPCYNGPEFFAPIPLEGDHHEPFL
jgi:hypothetical protein